jgi:hypothetical protein
MKNKIHQFVPDHIEGLSAKVIEFENFDNIKGLPWIKNFANHPKFIEFGLNSDLQIFAKYENGKQYIVGKVDNENGLESLKR